MIRANQIQRSTILAVYGVAFICSVIAAPAQADLHFHTWQDFLEGVQGADLDSQVSTARRYARVQLNGNEVLPLKEIEVFGWVGQ